MGYDEITVLRAVVLLAVAPSLRAAALLARDVEADPKLGDLHLALVQRAQHERDRLLVLVPPQRQVGATPADRDQTGRPACMRPPSP
jgi:hypothetical protein